jgi:hypothetical protein
VKVVGIDIAPVKGGHVCEDGLPPRHLKPAALDLYLKELPDDVLIAWDAPLTGPLDTEAWTDGKNDLYVRKIEKFFDRSQKGLFRAPDGISVRPYAGCPHWTISRRLLGLPRVGPYDLETGLPFKLVTDDQVRPTFGRHVVEVHPAVAIWRWCYGEYSGPWEYKGSGKSRINRVELCRLMSRRIGKRLIENASDDELDALTSWYLARCWLDRNGVMLLGNLRAGSFLLPEDVELRTAFENFLY